MFSTRKIFLIRGIQIKWTIYIDYIEVRAREKIPRIGIYRDVSEKVTESISVKVSVNNTEDGDLGS